MASSIPRFGIEPASASLALREVGLAASGGISLQSSLIGAQGIPLQPWSAAWRRLSTTIL